MESAPKATAPTEREPSNEPRTVEEAQDQISRARDELANTARTEASEEKPADTKKTQPTPPSASGAEAPSRTADPCAGRCRALASMRRAVTALCRMTGAEDARCVDAKRTLSDSEARVATCPCAHD